MKSLKKIKGMLCKELEMIADGGELSAGSLETLHKLTDTIKNIDKIEMLEEGGYSEEDEMAYESYDSGGSYGGGGSSRGSYGGGSYERGGSYRNSGRHYVRGHYSRDDGRRQMVEQLGGMMRNAGSEKEREAIRKCIDMIENA